MILSLLIAVTLPLFAYSAEPTAEPVAELDPHLIPHPFFGADQLSDRALYGCGPYYAFDFGYAGEPQPLTDVRTPKALYYAASLYALYTGDDEVTVREVIAAGFWPFALPIADAALDQVIGRRQPRYDDWLIDERLAQCDRSPEWLLRAKSTILYSFYMEYYFTWRLAVWQDGSLGSLVLIGLPQYPLTIISSEDLPDSNYDSIPGEGNEETEPQPEGYFDPLGASGGPEPPPPPATAWTQAEIDPTLIVPEQLVRIPEFWINPLTGQQMELGEEPGCIYELALAYLADLSECHLPLEISENTIVPQVISSYLPWGQVWLYDSPPPDTPAQ